MCSPRRGKKDYDAMSQSNSTLHSTQSVAVMPSITSGHNAEQNSYPSRIFDDSAFSTALFKSNAYSNEAGHTLKGKNGEKLG